MDASLPQSAGAHRHLQQIIAGLTEGVILVRPDQSLCWANQAALDMHGVTDLAELGADADAYRATFRLTYRNKHTLSAGDYPIHRVLRGEAFDEVVVQVEHADRAELRWTHQLRSLVLTDEGGTPELIVLIIEDKTAEFEAEERFERTFNANPAPAIICRLADLRYVKVNRGFLEMTGFSREQVIGRSAYDIDVLAQAERREQAIAALREGVTIQQQEACIAIAGGDAKYVIVAGQPIELADDACMLFTFIDLHERKRTETALRHSEARFATTFRLAPVAMAVTTLDDARFIDVNEAFATMTGRSQDDLLGRDTDELALWESAAARRGLHERLRKHGAVRHDEMRLRRADGTLLDCLVSAETVTILDRACILNVVQDITERKLREGELFTAIETVMKDTTWFSQKVIEKVADLRQARKPDLTSHGMETLTAREREVLSMMCGGATDAEIASGLDVSRNTIRNHVASIYDKIGVNRRSAAIVWARDRGLGPGAQTQRPPRSRGKPRVE